MRALPVALVLMVLAAGCSRQKTAEEKASPRHEAGPSKQVDTATTGSVRGVVRFQGTPPPAQTIDMSADPACQGGTSYQEVKAQEGKLGDAFVYVKSGLEEYSFRPPSEPAVIEQKGCRYHPAVLGVMVGQAVKIINRDAAMHNIHAMPKNSPQWNESQAAGGEPLKKTFSAPELMIPVKCNQHNWMRMHLNVVENPYFQVTGADGKFELKGLPPGEYVIAAVHARLGERTQKVTIEPRQQRSGVDFSFAEQK